MGPLRPLPSRRSLARRPRRRLSTALRRQPVVFWFLALLASASTYLVVHASLEAATEGADTYGALVSAVVATVDLAPGDVIGPADTALASLPASLVPSGAMRTEPVGRAVRDAIVAGEAVVDVRLAPEGAVGVAALLDDDERAVAIALPAHRAPIELGQVVDLLATVDPASSFGRSATSVIATGVVVVAVDEGGITVAASDDEAIRIATASASAVITVAISG